jgi:predicted Rossmann-fold nucleotide-binding protein
MESANRGGFDVSAKTVGLNITLPHEQFPNPYVSPGLCFSVRYFAVLKLHFLLRAEGRGLRIEVDFSSPMPEKVCKAA